MHQAERMAKFVSKSVGKEKGDTIQVEGLNFTATLSTEMEQRHIYSL